MLAGSKLKLKEVLEALLSILNLTVIRTRKCEFIPLVQGSLKCLKSRTFSFQSHEVSFQNLPQPKTQARQDRLTVIWVTCRSHGILKICTKQYFRLLLEEDDQHNISDLNIQLSNHRRRIGVYRRKNTNIILCIPSLNGCIKLHVSTKLQAETSQLIPLFHVLLTDWFDSFSY